MAKWISYFLLYAILQLFAWVITPLLPAFAVVRDGPANNGNATASEPRLPLWLSWFDTPVNSLWGDHGWQEKHCADSYWKYWGMVQWLYRNSLYGFKWSVLSAPITFHDMQVSGDPMISRNNGGRFGYLRITMGDYWQWKLIKPIWNTGYCIMLNFGWLLDDFQQKRGLFLFSPRICLIK